MKEYISTSIETIRKEFKNLQQELRREFKTQLLNNPTASTTPQDLEFNIANELSSSITTIKHDLESFRQSIQSELKKELETNITTAIQNTTSQLTTMITKEVNHALQAQLQALSPRNRKPKRSRAPNIDDSISQRLFPTTTAPSTHSREHNNDNDDDSYEASNALFEANMTVRPDSPIIQESDMEDMMIHQA